MSIDIQPDPNIRASLLGNSASAEAPQPSVPTAPSTVESQSPEIPSTGGNPEPTSENPLAMSVRSITPEVPTQNSENQSSLETPSASEVSETPEPNAANLSAEEKPAETVIPTLNSPESTPPAESAPQPEAVPSDAGLSTPSKESSDDTTENNVSPIESDPISTETAKDPGVEALDNLIASHEASLSKIDSEREEKVNKFREELEKEDREKKAELENDLKLFKDAREAALKNAKPSAPTTPQ
jgi:hypothetical protein